VEGGGGIVSVKCVHWNERKGVEMSLRQFIYDGVVCHSSMHKIGRPCIINTKKTELGMGNKSYEWRRYHHFKTKKVH
jgi:hypothetical protein